MVLLCIAQLRVMCIFVVTPVLEHWTCTLLLAKFVGSSGFSALTCKLGQQIVNALRVLHFSASFEQCKYIMSLVLFFELANRGQP